MEEEDGEGSAEEEEGEVVEEEEVLSDCLKEIYASECYE